MVRYWDLAATAPKAGKDPDWTSGALPPGLQTVELFSEPLVALMHTGHSLAEAGEEGLALAELADEPFVFFPRSYGTGLYDQLLNLARQAGFDDFVRKPVTGDMLVAAIIQARAKRQTTT